MCIRAVSNCVSFPDIEVETDSAFSKKCALSKNWMFRSNQERHFILFTFLRFFFVFVFFEELAFLENNRRTPRQKNFAFARM